MAINAIEHAWNNPTNLLPQQEEISYLKHAQGILIENWKSGEKNEEK